jgi:hypothetical protein
VNELQPLGRGLMLAGAVLLVVGALLAFGPKLPWIGRLPGDVVFRRGDFTFYFPLATSILLSVLLTLLFSFFKR